MHPIQQYNDGLLEDLGLETFREDSGWFGLGWYYVSLIELGSYKLSRATDRGDFCLLAYHLLSFMFAQNLTESRNYQQLAKERLELRLKRGKDSRRWYSTLFS